MLTKVSVSVSHELFYQGMAFITGEIVKECIVSAVPILVKVYLRIVMRSVLIIVAKQFSNEYIARLLGVLTSQQFKLNKKKNLHKLSNVVIFRNTHNKKS